MPGANVGQNIPPHERQKTEEPRERQDKRRIKIKQLVESRNDMNKKQWGSIVIIQILLAVLLLLFINFRTPPRQAQEPKVISGAERELLSEIYPKLSLYLPNLYELYFDGISYDENENRIMMFSDFCHLRSIGCFDGCVFVTIDSNNMVIKLSGCDMPTATIIDTMPIMQLSSLKRNLYTETHHSMAE